MSRFASLAKFEMTIDAINMTETTALAAPTTCRVEGLEAFLAERYLERHLPAAAAWCEEMGALLLEEVEEELTTLAEDLQLKPLERRRLFGPARKPRAAPAVPALALPLGKQEEDCSTESTVTAAELSTAATSPAETPVATPRAASPTSWTAWSWTRLALQVEAPPPRAAPPTADGWRLELDPEAGSWTWTQAPLPRVASDSTEPASEAEEGPKWVQAPTPPPALLFTKAAKKAPKAVKAAPKEDKEGFQEVERKHTEVTLQLRDADCGVLLGRGGKIVREIQDDSGARVTVLPKKDGARLRDAKVRGATKQVDAALELIKAVLPKLKEVTVEEWQLGALFGHRGETIAWIQRESSVRVDVLEEQQDGKRTVWIEGKTEAAVAKAKALVLECVKDVQPPAKKAKVGYVLARPLDHLPRGQGDRKHA